VLFSGVRLEASEIVEEWNSPQVGGPRLYGHSALQRLALRKVGRCEQRWVILPWPGRLGAGPVPAGATAASGPGAVSRASHSFTCHARRAAARAYGNNQQRFTYYGWACFYFQIWSFIINLISLFAGRRSLHREPHEQQRVIKRPQRLGSRILPPLARAPPRRPAALALPPVCAVLARATRLLARQGEAPRARRHREQREGWVDLRAVHVRRAAHRRRGRRPVLPGLPRAGVSGARAPLRSGSAAGRRAGAGAAPRPRGRTRGVRGPKRG